MRPSLLVALGLVLGGCGNAASGTTPEPADLGDLGDLGGSKVSDGSLDPDAAPGPDSSASPDLSTRAMPNCADGKLDGDETDVDCGGSCGACRSGQHCQVGNDCGSDNCANQICAPPGVVPTCSDGKKDGHETDLDCGGGDCRGCALGLACLVGRDCASGACTHGRCVQGCQDGVLDGNETGIDCGGSCAPCPNGKGCKLADDCASGRCENNSCGPPPIIAPLMFAPPVAYAPGVAVNLVAAADVDGDGYCDAIAAFGGYTPMKQPPNLAVYLGRADGSLDGGHPIRVQTPLIRTLDIADFDGNGAPDFAAQLEVDPFLGNATYPLGVFLGDGAGGFQAAAQSIGDLGRYALGDVNGDQQPDAVYSAPSYPPPQQLDVALGDGSGQLRAAAGPFPTLGAQSGPIVLADWNGDGHVDAATVTLAVDAFGQAGTTIWVFLGDGAGGLGAPLMTAGPTSPGNFIDQGLTLLADDLDGDGHEDLALGFDGLYVLRGQGDGTFMPSPNPLPVGVPVAMILVDFDGDGHRDLALSDNAGADLTVLLGRGDGTFPTSFGFFVGGTPTSIAAGDIDGDGKPDLFVANTERLQVLLNRSP